MLDGTISPQPTEASEPDQPAYIEVKALASAVVPALFYSAAHVKISLSAAELQLTLEWQAARQGGMLQASQLEAALKERNLRLQPRGFEILQAERFASIDFPLLVLLKDGRAVVIEKQPQGAVLPLTLFEGGSAHEIAARAAALVEDASAVWTLHIEQSVPDSRVEGYLKPTERNWLRDTLFPSVKPYAYVVGASLVCNLLALAGMIFSMQVYDRVIPARSYNTLAVLGCGVGLAFVFEYLIRLARSALLDGLGKDAGLRLSERVFARALRIRMDARPPSTGSFISQLRDIDSLREQLTSSAVTAVMDLPFFFLFLALLASVGGWLALIPMAAFVLMLAPAVLLQGKLRSAAQGAQRESALRNAVLVETIQGADDIKALRAESRFEAVWGETSRATSKASMRQKQLIAQLTTWTQTVQQAVYAATVAIGAPLVMNGSLTTGTVVGASILGARMLAPMAQISSVLSRWQQAKMGAAALNDLMQKAIDLPSEEQRVNIPVLRGNITIANARYSYAQMQNPVLEISALSIAAGERIGVLGRNGAGKSTLLQALSGMVLPQSGSHQIDGHEIGTLDPADLRRDVILLSQTSRLFHGTLRENMRFGAPLAQDADIVAALHQAGGQTLLQNMPKGLDHLIAEGGMGLSGGQKQVILLARTLLRHPRLLLLDEPSAAMDESAERQLLGSLLNLPAGTGLIVATHRLRLLDAVDRLIVVEGGKIVMDGEKNAVLAKLKRAPL